jgi:hypothetical protein
MAVVKQVNEDKKGMIDFINLPYNIYRNDSNWCPTLKIERKRFFSRSNPFSSHSKIAYFVAYKGAKPIGRVTAHIDELYNGYHNTKHGFFGFFESPFSLDVAESLMKEAEHWLGHRGMTKIIGPLNFSTNHEVGFLTKGFDRPPVIMMPYTKDYYPRMLYRLGYGKEKELIAYWQGNVKGIPLIVEKAVKRLKRRFGDAIHIRNISKRNLKSDLRIILDIYNDAWSKNWGFVPFTDDEILKIAKELKFIAIPDITSLLYWDGEPVAFFFAVPDINEVLVQIRTGRLLPTGLLKLLLCRHRIRTARVMLMGVKRKYQRHGLDFMMYYRMYDAMLRKTTLKNIEMSAILEDNHMMIKALERLNAYPYKKYVVLKKDLK